MSLGLSVEEIIINSSNPSLNINPSWKRIRLEKVASVINGYPFESLYFNSKEGFPLLRIRDIIRGYSETLYSGKYDPMYVINTGDLIVGMDGDFNCVRWQGQPALLNQRVCKIEVNSKKYDPVFLALVLPSYLREINDHTSSITVKHLSSRTIQEIPLPYPHLDEQHQIVAKLESVLTQIHTARTALEGIPRLLKSFRQSVLAAAFRGELTERDPSDEPAEMLLARIRTERKHKWEENLRAKSKNPANFIYEEPESPDTSNLPELPEGWVWEKIGSVFDVSLGGTPARDKPEYWNGKVPWVSSGEVAFCNIKETKEKITDLGLSHSNAKYIPPNNVLLAMIGEGKTRGQAAILDIPATTNQNIAAINCAITPLKPEWLLFWFMYQYEEVRGGGLGGAQPALNAKRIKELVFPILPIKEQDLIIIKLMDLFSQIETIESTVRNASRLLDTLEQAALSKAFRGEL